MADFGLSCDIDHEEMVVTVTIVPSTPNTIQSPLELDEKLKSEDVLYGVDHQAIEDVFQQLPLTEEAGASMIIAKGEAVRHGQNGRIDFKVDVSGKAKYNIEDEEDDESIDFKEAVSIAIVKEGDLLAELIAPTAGEKGVTLQGKKIPARHGKVITLRPDDTIKVEGDGRLFYAVCSGRPVYNRGHLCVSAVYEIAKDVDYETGNIKFEGHVIVKGNVLDGFSIHAKSVEIIGTVGACEIHCDSLSISNGINGRDKGTFFVNGDMNAKYINQAQLTINGNLQVSREVVNSRIWCNGVVEVRKLIGGHCLALRGVQVAWAGSELGIPTVIEPGVNFEIRAIDDQLSACDEKIEAVLKPNEPFFGDRKRFRSLPDERKERFREAYKTFQALHDEKKALYQSRDKLLEDESYEPVKKVVILNKMYPDVSIRTDSCTRHFKTELNGPIVLLEEIDTGSIQPAPYTQAHHLDTGD